MPSLAARLHAQSPRYTPRPIPWRSRAIGAGVPILFVALVGQAFLRQGLAVWSVGLCYIGYDTVLLLFTAWQIRRLGSGATASPSVTPGAAPAMGIIVAAHDEGRIIAAMIDRLLAQVPPPDVILIADDGSSDGTAAALEPAYGIAPPDLHAVAAVTIGPTDLRWLRLPHGGKARALNAALERIDTAVVLTVDADTLLEPGAVAAIRAAFAAEPALVAATGVLVPICGPTPKGRLFEWFQSYEYVRNFLSRDAWMRLDSLLLISGAFAAFRRDAVLTVGGFDPDCMVEDYELIHRLHRHAADTGLDWRVRVVGGAVARTDAPAGVAAFLKQRQRWFGGFLQTQRWNRDMVGDARYGRLGTRMLPVKAIDTLQPIYGLGAFAILVALVATGRFTLAFPILLVMIAKIAVDLSFHLWSLGIYKRWTGQRQGLRLVPALIAAVLEPFSFQLLRHAGAIYGWIAFLRGRQRWSRASRTALETGAPRHAGPE